MPDQSDAASGNATMPVIAAAANAAGGLFGQLFANRANKRESELAYRRQLSMWNRTNEYNSPEMQMERLRKAGLNPNLVYGTGAVANVSGPGPRYEPPVVRPVVPDFGGSYAVFQNAMMNQLQLKQAVANIEQVQAQTEYTRMRTTTEGLNQGLTTVTTDTKKSQLEQMLKLQPYQYEITKQQNWQAQARTEMLIQQLKNMTIDEQRKLLENEYLANKVSQQDIDKELKQAELLMKDNSNDLRSMGVTESDNILVRILVRMMNQNGMSMKDIAPQKGKNWDKYIKDK